jgi:hypothetical protein
MSGLLPTVQVADITPLAANARWLVRDIWAADAVGVVGGAPKSCKSWLGLDIAVSVASGTACLGHFAVDAPGRAVVFLAEDALPRVRERVAALCEHRGIDLQSLDLHVITAAGLRLDVADDREQLDATLTALAPRILVLDPLVRMHTGDENSAADISALLGFLRTLNRRHHVAIVLVHHMAKRARRNLGQALRGSGDVHAWTDSACYLVRTADDRLRLTIEHRAAAAPPPMLLQLDGEQSRTLHLQLVGADVPPPPLMEKVRDFLRRADKPLSRAAIRRELRVNNKRVGDALEELAKRGLAQRDKAGWVLAGDDDNPQMLIPGAGQ